jgi:two-component sensor histidine kinase
MKIEHLLALLPERPQPVIVRIAGTVALVVICFLFRLAAGRVSGEYGFILFVPGVVLPALMFDRGSAFFALGLSLGLIGTLQDWSSAEQAQAHLAAALVFSFIGLFLVLLVDGFRNALEQALATEHDHFVLLRELGHRIKNDLATAFSIMVMQARLHRRNPEARAELDAAALRLRVLASSYDHLRIAPRDTVIDMAPFLEELCAKLADTLRGVRPIEVKVAADGVLSRSDKAARVGLIANELVTNAFKHAFPDNRAGSVNVSLRRADHHLELMVEDDGVGCPEKSSDGLGSRLVQLLTQQLGGNMEREPASPGCRVRVVIPPERMH